ncbi:MAG TPA: feruloyl-CoA synthase [Vicinamibacterales bacterium]|jgi:feruloyl-CoA synthase
MTPIRAVRIAATEATVRFGDDGVVYMKSPFSLGAYPTRLTERLEEWADRAPDRPFLAQRDAQDAWRCLTYSQVLTRVRSISQALINRGLSQEKPILILSGNSIEHALLALASMYGGVLYAPVAPAYSLQAREYGTLGRIFNLMKPRLVFAADGAPYERALRSVLPPDVELVVAGSPGELRATTFDELQDTPATTAVDAARDRVNADTIAKILFTSGSTGNPKGVINTQRMLCSNQEMIRSVIAFLEDEPPVLCDWLPWNHTAGGNHNFGLVLYNGGTLYIDDGRPLPSAFDRTVRNLREIAATAHFAVPRTYEMLLPHLRTDRALRERFFSRLKLLLYAAAGLSQRFFDEVRALAVETIGEEILWMTGFGATETAPFALSTGRAGTASGVLGLPAPGLELKLAPVGTKIEARLRGPSITPGYWKEEALTRAAFDDEGFYRLGDAMRFADPNDPAKGLLFDGRLAEDFKLSTGTWVSVGPLRAKFLAVSGGYTQDVVIAGHDREFVAALIFPNLHNCTQLCPELNQPTPADIIEHPNVRRQFTTALDELARQSTGSSTYVVRAIILDQPPSIDAREITDKGSLNQKAVLQNRAALVEELYAPGPSPRIISATPAQ